MDDLVDELEETIKKFLDELYISITKPHSAYCFSDSEKEIDFELATPIKSEKKNQVPKNLFFTDFSVFNKLVVKIEEGANFPYKTRGKRNTIVTLKIHSDLPSYFSKISENHTKHAIYDTEFEIDISKINLTRMIPIIFVFDKSMKTGELELLGLHFIELQRGKVVNDQVFIYNNDWIDIYTKETRTYNGSLKVTLFFKDLKEIPNDNEIIEKVNKKRERISPNSINNTTIVSKLDEGVQTDEYYEEITPDKIEGNGELNYSMIHNKSSRFIFVDDDEIINDDFVYKSEAEKLDIEKILFQDEVDDKIVDLLEPIIKYENVEGMDKRMFNPDDDQNDKYLFNSQKVYNDVENDVLVKKLTYNSDNYSTYSDFKWNYGYDDFWWMLYINMSSIDLDLLFIEICENQININFKWE